MIASIPSRKLETEEPSLRLAVLIDADNAQASVIEGLLAEIARFGEATVKRIYGDFTSSASSQWKKVLNKHAIKPIQQFAYTTGKNATETWNVFKTKYSFLIRKPNPNCEYTLLFLNPDCSVPSMAKDATK